MIRVDYRNPMTKIYQHEYVLYMLMSHLFYKVNCSSEYLLKTLKLYYMDLSNVSKFGNVSFERQYRLENKIEYWIKRDVIGTIVFPHIHRCRVNLDMYLQKDGSHLFVFSDGIYAFSVSLKLEKEKIVGLAVRNLV